MMWREILDNLFNECIMKSRIIALFAVAASVVACTEADVQQITPESNSRHLNFTTVDLSTKGYWTASDDGTIYRLKYHWETPVAGSEMALSIIKSDDGMALDFSGTGADKRFTYLDITPDASDNTRATLSTRDQIPAVEIPASSTIFGFGPLKSDGGAVNVSEGAVAMSVTMRSNFYIEDSEKLASLEAAQIKENLFIYSTSETLEAIPAEGALDKLDLALNYNVLPAVVCVKIVNSQAYPITLSAVTLSAVSDIDDNTENDTRPFPRRVLVSSKGEVTIAAETDTQVNSSSIYAQYRTAEVIEAGESRDLYILALPNMKNFGTDLAFSATFKVDGKNYVSEIGTITEASLVAAQDGDGWFKSGRAYIFDKTYRDTEIPIDAALAQTTVALNEIDATNYPLDYDKWVITSDAEPTADEFAGLKAALTTLNAETNRRKIELTFSDATVIPANALYQGAVDSKDIQNYIVVALNLPNVVETGSMAFRSNKNLVTITAPKLKTIGENTFRACNKIVSISLDAAKSIGEDAFGYCSLLETVEIPQVTTLGLNAFRSCVALSTINSDVAGQINLSTLESLTSNVFVDCDLVSDVYIPNVVLMGANQFKNCDGLKRIEIATADVPFVQSTSATQAIFDATVDLSQITIVTNYKLSDDQLGNGTTVVDGQWTIPHKGGDASLSEVVSGYMEIIHSSSTN